jgi:hypothetical protein
MNNTFWRLPVVILASGLLLVGWLFLVDSSPVSSNWATLRYVAPDGNCGSNTPCYSQVQAAVDAADSGDELRVAAGLYTGVSSRNGTTQLVYINKSITIRGGYHPQDWTQDPALNPTFLDAQEQGRVLFIVGNVSPVVDGFHILNGSGGNGGGAYIETAAAILSRNEIYENWAEGQGGGVYLKNSPAIIDGNHIYSNTTGASGRGGGIALIDSPATVQGNFIERNRAHVGGGVELNNSIGTAGALLTGNTIHDNEAFDFEEDGHIFDGAGGGVDCHSYLTDTLKNNTISNNMAKWGGGVHAFSAMFILIDNTVQENYAPYHGGGLYVQGGQVSLEGNNILTNTADNWGGGLTLLGGSAQVRANTFQGNTAGWRGGGLYVSSGAQFDGNRFLGNTAIGQGGGAFLIWGSGSVYQNSVFVGNHAAEGGGLYLWAANTSLLHSTLSNNSSDDDHAVVIDKYPGLVDPGATTLYTATVVFSNSIVAGQPVGFFVTSGNRLTVDGVLWHATPTHFQADGADLTVNNERSGDPDFQADGYHIRTHSPARDGIASTLDHDVDGHLRDWGNQKDLGADEFVPVVLVSPENGGELTYIAAQEDVTITVRVPPGAVSATIGLMLSPFPPPPPEVLNSPFGMFFPISPPFRLDPFFIDTSQPVSDTVDPPLGELIPDAVIFEHYPADVIAELGVEKLKQYYHSMQQLELSLLAIINAPTQPLNAACGPMEIDPDKGSVTAPICNTGMITPTLHTASDPPVHLAKVGAGSETGYFIFLIKANQVFLPVMRR